MGKHDAAIAEGERSVELAPNHADNAANLACSYVVASRPADAVVMMRKAMRLSPVFPTWYLSILGFGHYQRGEYAEAEAVLKQALEREPAFADARLFLTLCYHARGLDAEARREAAEVVRHNPKWTLKNFETNLSIVKDRAMVAVAFATLRSLGLS